MQRGQITAAVTSTMSSRPLPLMSASGVLDQIAVNPLAPASPTCAMPPVIELHHTDP
jgi:hypothetical protein